MSNISPINAKPPERITSPEPSPALRRLFDAGQLLGDDAERAARDCPTIIDEAKALLPSLQRKVEAAGEVVVRQVIGARLETFPQPQRSDAGWDAWWNDYFDALADEPAFAIEAGMREWVKTDVTGFMPKPGQLLALVKAAAGPHWRALSRAQRVAKLPPPRPLNTETLEERQAAIAAIHNLIKPKDIEQ